MQKITTVCFFMKYQLSLRETFGAAVKKKKALQVDDQWHLSGWDTSGLIQHDKDGEGFEDQSREALITKQLLQPPLQPHSTQPQRCE